MIKHKHPILSNIILQISANLITSNLSAARNPTSIEFDPIDDILLLHRLSWFGVSGTALPRTALPCFQYKVLSSISFSDKAFRFSVREPPTLTMSLKTSS